MSQHRKPLKDDSIRNLCSVSGTEAEGQVTDLVKADAPGVEVPLDLLDNIDLYCAIVDAAGDVVSANEWWQSIFGAPSAERPSEPIWELLSEGEDPPPSAVRDSLRNLELGQTVDLGKSRLEQDGQVARDIVWKCSRTSAKQSDECFYLVVGQDLTSETTLRRSLLAAQRDLAESQQELMRKNTALKEVIATVEAEKKAVAGIYEHNISRVVEPLLQQLKERSRASEKHSIEVLESCLRSVLSPSAGTLERVCRGLTSREIQICNMIRQGFATKQIASVLSLSSQTIQTHRKNIRRKLGIRSQRVSLEKSLKRLEHDGIDSEGKD